MNPLECSPGYAGPNCSIQCPYPTYGEKCHGYCECDKDICDFATGSIRLTTVIYLDNYTSSHTPRFNINTA